MGCMESASEHESFRTKQSLINALCLNETKKIISMIEREPNVIREKVNFRDDTIMHYAFHKENIELIRYLKECGAEFNIKNKVGKTPLDLTKSAQIKQIIGQKKQQKNDDKENLQYYFIRLGDIRVSSKQINEPVCKIKPQSWQKDQLKEKNLQQLFFNKV